MIERPCPLVVFARPITALQRRIRTRGEEGDKGRGTMRMHCASCGTTSTQNSLLYTNVLQVVINWFVLIGGQKGNIYTAFLQPPYIFTLPTTTRQRYEFILLPVYCGYYFVFLTFVLRFPRRNYLSSQPRHSHRVGAFPFYIL